MSPLNVIYHPEELLVPVTKNCTLRYAEKGTETDKLETALAALAEAKSPNRGEKYVVIGVVPTVDDADILVELPRVVEEEKFHPPVKV